MVRGLYTAATGMITQRNTMDVLTNNAVNVETTGFKADSLKSSTFDATMLSLLNDPNATLVGSNVGTYDFGTHLQEVFTDFAEGSYEESGTDTDLALTGDGFFVVETEQGEQLTRAGNFAVDGSGDLVTADGCYVLGQNGHINVGSDNFTVEEDGRVYTESGDYVDTLRLETVEDTAVLRKDGDTRYYLYGEDAATIPADNVTVKQGFQETSNVNMTDTMVDMITIYRKYEANQKVVTMTDETIGMAVNKLGTLS